MNRDSPWMQTPFFLAGAPKSGTSTLARLLQQHKQIHIPSKKELFYFDFNYEKGVSWYNELFKGIKPHQLPGDCTPWYMSWPQAPERIARTFPNAKIIFILRDPVSRTWSHFWHDYRSLYLDLKCTPASYLLSREDPRRIRACSYYGRQLSHWLTLFDPSQLMLVSTHWLSSDPAALCNSILSFLGLAASKSWLRELPKERLMMGQRPRPWRVRQLARLQSKLDGETFNKVSSLLRRHPKLHRRFFYHDGAMPIPSNDREALEKLYQEDQRQLQSLTGVDMTIHEGPVFINQCSSLIQLTRKFTPKTSGHFAA